MIGTLLIGAFTLGGLAVLAIRWFTSPGHFRAATGEEASRQRLYEVGAFREKHVVGVRWQLFNGDVESISLSPDRGRALARLLIECCDRADRYSGSDE